MNRNKWIVNFVVGFVKLTGYIPAMLFLKPRVQVAANGKRKLPKPAILVSNHCSLMDFVLYLMVFPFRTIRFLMAEVLFNKGKIFAAFLRALGGIRVDRQDKNFGFVSDSIEVLDQGGILGVFPQGRLPVGGETVPFTVSTAFIASHADAPIIPVYTDGNYGLFKRTNVVIGEAFYLQDYADLTLEENARLEKLTSLLQEKVYELAEMLEKREAHGKAE